MDILVLFCDLSLFYSIHLLQNNFLRNDLFVVRYEIEKAFPYEFPSINNYYHQCLSPNLFRPDQFYLSDFPRKVVLSYTEIFLKQWVLLQEMAPFGIIKPCSEIGIINLLESQMSFFLTEEDVTIIRCRHVGLCPLLAEGIVIVLFDHRTVGGDNLPHAAQMIRQEIARFQTLRRDYEPSPAERGAFQVERSVLRAIYQRTQITQPVAGGLRRREFRLLKCKRLSRPCLQVRKITTKIKVLNV